MEPEETHGFFKYPKLTKYSMKQFHSSFLVLFSSLEAQTYTFCDIFSFTRQTCDGLSV